ncbi:hypothetical protein EVAR_42823_1 [Eumeta japonica]|uniref:Uncharacterized protein n=1 Tax=Eumeta variegata TaxID=151549 RepID=A0A4C1WHZ0_EUMVA|nr:hypothetical protein EVAR_42823_1 [Eumeta japonica]
MERSARSEVRSSATMIQFKAQNEHLQNSAAVALMTVKPPIADSSRSGSSNSSVRYGTTRNTCSTTAKSNRLRSPSANPLMVAGSRCRLRVEGSKFSYQHGLETSSNTFVQSIYMRPKCMHLRGYSNYSAGRKGARQSIRAPAPPASLVTGPWRRSTRDSTRNETAVRGRIAAVCSSVVAAMTGAYYSRAGTQVSPLRAAQGWLA